MLPELFLKRMQEMLGDEYPAFLESYDKDRYQALRLNALKIRKDGRSAAQLPDRQAEHGSEADREVCAGLPWNLTKVPWAENGYYYDKEDQPGKHPYHEAGVYYIQEPSAMAPVGMLKVCPGEKVLDLCAAPGGKSTQIAAALKGQGLLVCNEIHPARAKILSENIERMGVRNACVTNETPAHLAEVFPEYFDRILVDAPCSGEGMFRKNDEACDQWSPENVKLCAERQQEILDCAAVMLRPGGRLVYSTCTFAPEENEEGMERFLQRHSGFQLLEATRLWPHKIQGEGHFAAVLTKNGSVPEDFESISAGGIQKGLPDKELQEWKAFCKEFLSDDWFAKHAGSYIKFGENLYLIPENMPNLKGLKVLRPGLQVGEIKKDRFEPSHALALALSPEEVKQVYDLSSTDRLSRAFINGETFPAEGGKGWHLVCVDGFSLGWGKLAGNIMKNHYPKGLRKNL